MSPEFTTVLFLDNGSVSYWGKGGERIGGRHLRLCSLSASWTIYIGLTFTLTSGSTAPGAANSQATGEFQNTNHFPDFPHE